MRYERHPFAQRCGVALRQLRKCRVVNACDCRVGERGQPSADFDPIQPAIVLLPELLTSLNQLLSRREHART